MRAKSQKHAEYEIVEAILHQFNFAEVFTKLGGVKRGGVPDDPVAWDRVTKACGKLRRELERKQEKLRKYLPEDHLDYEEKGEEKI